MNGKPVLQIPAKGVINFQSHFGPKKLCDSLTFSTGSACAYGCSFCYVPSMFRKDLRIRDLLATAGVPFEGAVIRRTAALETMRQQLLTRGKPKFTDPADTRVIYSSPTVDVAANLELVAETIEACKIILELTHWHIRLLSKSSFLPRIAEALCDHRDRMIYGVSTGTLNDKLAAAFEQGTARVSKRIESLHQMQDAGFRTYGMICPSLPQQTEADYLDFSRDLSAAIRADRCEHVWAEVINVRGESMNRTCQALEEGGFAHEGRMLREASSPGNWEPYARQTFLAHRSHIPAEKLRFLQYVGAQKDKFWKEQESFGAVLL